MFRRYWSFRHARYCRLNAGSFNSGGIGLPSASVFKMRSNNFCLSADGVINGAWFGVGVLPRFVDKVGASGFIRKLNLRPARRKKPLPPNSPRRRPLLLMIFPPANRSTGPAPSFTAGIRASLAGSMRPRLFFVWPQIFPAVVHPINEAAPPLFWENFSRDPTHPPGLGDRNAFALSPPRTGRVRRYPRPSDGTTFRAAVS